MHCCVNCFSDNEIRAIISSQNVKGACDFCKNTNTLIYDIDDSERILLEIIYGLISTYSSASSLPATFPTSEIKPLQDILYDDWCIFNLPKKAIGELIKAICKEKYIDDPELFDSPVGLKQLHDEEYLKKNSLLRERDWDYFVNDIKTNNRFHFEYLNTDVLSSFVNTSRTIYKAGQILYRARVSKNKEGYQPAEMGAPPSYAAKAGRVNSEGISVLYLADSIETVVYEVRAGRYDYITIGTFELTKDITIVGLDSLKNASPFSNYDGYAAHAINFKHLSRLSQEVARPMRRNDSNLDYLPTQFFSDFIKKQKDVSGISFASVMAANGTNVAVFTPDLFRCIKTQVLEIDNIQYSWIDSTI